MAKYTVELRDIVKSGLKVFDFPYEFYDDTKKAEFEQKFIDHFLFREIGTETVGRFQHYLKCKCRETLPYYNLLLKTAEYEYDVKNNYNLTETFTKTITNTKTSTGNINQNGTTDNTETVASEKINTLDSTTQHTEDNEINHVEDIDETGKLDKTSTLDIDGKKVQSDTPNGLLSMTDIKNNVYASKADVEDTTNKTVDAQTNSANKKSNSTDTTTATVTDTVDATSGDSLTGTTHNNGTVANTTNANQNESDNGTESYTLERNGDIGVDTTPDKLKKHIEIQKILTTIYIQFFDECEDLFMQVY
jgi:hypothetical protein